MKYKLINNKTKEEHLCDKITIDEFDYYVSDDVITKGWRGFAYKKDVKGQIFKHFYTLNTWYDDAKKVIATNNPNGDIPKIVDEVERLAEKLKQTKYIDGSITTWTKNDWQSCWKEGFKDGYNKSQETHPNSDEDMKDFGYFCVRHYKEKVLPKKSFEELLQIWKDQLPKVIYYE